MEVYGEKSWCCWVDGGGGLKRRMRVCGPKSHQVFMEKINESLRVKITPSIHREDGSLDERAFKKRGVGRNCKGERRAGY